MIPEKVTWEGKDYTVTEIGANAFKYWLYAAFYNGDPYYGTILFLQATPDQGYQFLQST